jgi:hypothetical protein
VLTNGSDLGNLALSVFWRIVHLGERAECRAVVLGFLSLDGDFFSPLLTDTISFFLVSFLRPVSDVAGGGGGERAGGSIIPIMMIMNEDLD